MIYYLFFNQRRKTQGLYTMEQFANTLQCRGKRHTTEYRCFQIETQNYCDAKCVDVVVWAFILRGIKPEIKDVNGIARVTEIQPPI